MYARRREKSKCPWSIVLILVIISTVGSIYFSFSYHNNQLKKNSFKKIQVVGLLNLDENNLNQKELQNSQKKINNFLETIDSKYRLDVSFENTKNNSSIAFEQLQSLTQDGFKIFLGPEIPEIPDEMLNFIQSNQILLINSVFSNNIDFPNKLKNYFKLTPSVEEEVQEFINLLKREYLKYIIVVDLNQLHYDEFYSSLIPQLENSNIIINDHLFIEDQTSIPSFVTNLNRIVNRSFYRLGYFRTGIVILGNKNFEKFIVETSKYPQLEKAKWYTSENNTSDFLKLSNQEYLNRLKLKYHKLSLEKPISSLNHDLLWILTLSRILSDSKFNLTFEEISNKYFGETGHFKIDENGRRANWNYEWN